MTSGSKAFVIYNKKFILILRDDKPSIPWPNVWNLPGGGVEEGEAPLEVVKRELEEEICVVPEQIEYLGRQELPDNVYCDRFAAFLTKEEFEQVKLGDEGQKLEFFTIDEAEKLEHTSIFQDFFNENKEKIRALVEEKKLFQL